MDALFRFATNDVELSMEGSEAFVREQIRKFLPANGASRPSPEPTERPEAPKAPSSPLKAWFESTFPSSKTITMQDAILVFGYFLKRERDQHMFRPADMKRSFRDVGRRIPKSLLQIMGTLKRDHELLWSPEGRRGVYALSPKGIKRVEGMLGAEDTPTPRATQPQPKPQRKDEATLEREIRKAPAFGAGEQGGLRSSSERWSLLFKGNATKG